MRLQTISKSVILSAIVGSLTIGLCNHSNASAEESGTDATSTAREAETGGEGQALPESAVTEQKESKDAERPEEKPAAPEKPEVTRQVQVKTEPSNSSGAAEKKRTKVSVQEIAKGTSAIRLRLEKEHRIRLADESFDDKARAHVYQFLAEHQLPFVFTLGWFDITTSDSGSTETNAASDKKSSSKQADDDIDTEDDDPKKKKKKKKEKDGLTSFKELIRSRDVGPFDKNAALLDPEGDSSLVAIDEEGFTLPVPGAGPKEKEYNKADWINVVAFDLVSAGNLEKAEKELENALKEDNLAKVHNNLAALYGARGDFEKGLVEVEKAIELNEEYAAAHANRALLLLGDGNPEDAFAASKKAFALDKAMLSARVAMARSLLESGKKSEALELAEAMKSQSPSEWQARLVLADAQVAAENFKEARDTLRQLTVLSPRNPSLSLKLAMVFEKLGDLDSAISYAKKAAQIAPDDAKAHISLGRYLEANRDGKAALLQYERAVDLKPSEKLGRLAMGPCLRILIQENNLAKADDLSKKWTKTYPNMPDSHYNRAWIVSQLEEKGSSEEAIKEYRKALELNPKLVSARYNLALLLAKTGQNQEAARELQKFLKTAPDDKDSDSARKLLKHLTPSD